MWKKSSLCNDADNCVEVDAMPDGVRVRSTIGDPHTVLCFSAGEWEAFLKGVKNAEFDLHTMDGVDGG